MKCVGDGLFVCEIGCGERIVDVMAVDVVL